MQDYVSACLIVRLRFSALTDQGVKNLTAAEANERAVRWSAHWSLFAVSNDAFLIQGTNPDFGTEDLYEAIESKNYPSWTVYIQVLSPSAARDFKCELSNLGDLLPCWWHNIL